MPLDYDAIHAAYIAGRTPTAQAVAMVSNLFGLPMADAWDLVTHEWAPELVARIQEDKRGSL